MSNAGMDISGAVEGDVDEVLVRHLLNDLKLGCGMIYGKKGKDYLRKRIVGYNTAARFSPWIVLVDLDHEANCAPELKKIWLSRSEKDMHFRVAVRSIEAWLLADCCNLADFLKVDLKLLPDNPDILDNPKEAMVNLARNSKSHDIFEDMVPRKGSDRNVGPAYQSQMIEFIKNKWDYKKAMSRSNSLKRCVINLKTIRKG